MDFMTAADIRNSFNKYKEVVRTEEERDAMRHVSRAIADLRNEGIPVSLEIAGWCGSDAFKSGGQSASACGILTIGHGRHLLVLINKVDNASCLSLRLSYYNMDQGELDNRASMFDMRNDPQAIVQFQDRILEIAASSASLHEADVAGAFEKPAHATPSKGIKL